MLMTTYADILSAVIENGRLLLSDESGCVNRVELEAEIAHEANERGTDTAGAIAYALEHTDWYQPKIQIDTMEALADVLVEFMAYIADDQPLHRTIRDLANDFATIHFEGV
jgi:hypothetical protein